MTVVQIRKYIFLSVIALALLAGGCSSYTIFNTSKEEQIIKPGTIVVIAGSPEETDIRLAELFTDYLQKKTRFNVVTQETVFEKMPGYPLYSITKKMTESNAKQNNSPWIPEDMKSNLTVYQQQLKTDYILLVWSDNLLIYSGQGGTSYGIDFMSRLVEVPGNNVIGYSSYRRNRGSCISTFFSTNINIDKMLGDISEEVVEELAKKTLSN